jgi:photosystem II stability/assembly factor-like uncharacterized protein
VTRIRSSHFRLLPVLAAALLALLTGGCATGTNPSAARGAIGTWAAANGPEGRSVAAIAVDPRYPAIVYAGTNAGSLFKSTNRGGTWRELNVGPAGVIRGALTIDPRKTSTVYLGTARGVFKSGDGGRSWRSASAGLFGKETPQERGWRLGEGWVTELAIHPRSSRIVYASTYGGVAKSTDGGRRWRRVNAGLTIDGGGGKRIPRPLWTVALDPQNAKMVYAAGIGGVFKSTNGGGRWRLAGRPRRMVQALALDPQKPPTIYAGTPRGVFKSSDGGSRWRFSGLERSSVGSLAVQPGRPQTVYAATARGIFKSTDAGGNWRSASVGMTAGFVSVLAVDPRNPETLYAGTSEGLFKSTDAGGSWTLVLDPEPEKPGHSLYAGDE